jgi:hypothetical protein
MLYIYIRHSMIQVLFVKEVRTACTYLCTHIIYFLNKEQSRDDAHERVLDSRAIASTSRRRRKRKHQLEHLPARAEGVKRTKGVRF